MVKVKGKSGSEVAVRYTSALAKVMVKGKVKVKAEEKSSSEASQPSG